MQELTLSSQSEGKYSEKGSTFTALTLPVASLDQVKNAVAHAMRDGRNGKVVLLPNA